MSLSLGTDVVMIERFRLALRRTPSIQTRLFTDRERDYAATCADPAPALAVRFAAKEAVMKALGSGIGSMRFKEIEVRRDDAGAPKLELVGLAAQAQDRAGIDSWLVSLSHTDEVALAVVIGQN